MSEPIKKKEPKNLGEMCMQMEGKCCEERTPPVLMPYEVEILLIGTEHEQHFKIGKGHSYATPKKRCTFFKQPLCGIYEKRPVDCKTYPVSIQLGLGGIEYVLDKKCPAVEKGLVDKEFIQTAVHLWTEGLRKLEDPKKWMEEYGKHDPRKYDWIYIDEYILHVGHLRKQQKKQK